MRIRRVGAVPVVLEATPFWSAYGIVSDYYNVFVQVEDDEGRIGIGEASPWRPLELGETQETITFVIEHYLAPALIGQDAMQIAVLVDRMDHVIASHVVAKAAVEMAIYDLAAKAIGRPLYDLLGGPFRTSFPTFGAVVIQQPGEALEEMAHHASRVASEGFATIKIKLPSLEEEPPSRTVERIRLIREAVGPGVRLIADPNQGWLTAGVALPIMRQIAPYDMYVEQPISRTDYEGMALLTRTAPVSIIADEAAFTFSGLLEIGRRGGAHVVNIKVSRCGGFWKAQKMIALAEAMGLQCQIDDVAATRVTTTAAAHLACAVPIQTFFGYSVGPASQWLKRDVVRVGGITIERGNVHMPEGPGLGVSLAPDVIEEAAARVVGPMRRS